ncbi:putative bifunctional diguanylate cyclase/phosphodiesterase [Andreprevotia chitinilytica]|uniref:putative bifunctional diguanylate cyclase/phosphodiesterase n=1 Tax=Andreprevotia chitinilytica TaxID=396808 RepID=UPI000A046591|nr:EAL domain-containing protein [Andreprevotia chitinilytica]
MSVSLPLPTTDPPASLAVLERRLERERAARKAAEQLLNEKSLALYEAMQRSAHSQNLLELALWASGESIWEWSADNDEYIMRAFPSADNPPVISRGLLPDFMARVHPDDINQALLSWAVHASGASELLDMAVRYRHYEGWRWVRIRGKAVATDPDGWALRIVGTAKDITTYRETEHSFRLMASAFASSRDAMMVLTEAWQIIEANAAFHTLLAGGSDAVVGSHLSNYVDLTNDALHQFGRLGHAQCESTFRDPNDNRIPVEVTLSRFAAEDGRSSYLIATMRNITDRRRAANELERVARFDTLTQLPNRATLQARLAQEMARLSTIRPLAILFIDLDGFKEVNDSLGHDAGDELLQVMTRRLMATLELEDMLARWGGDEFVVMLNPGIDVDRPLRVARQILTTLSQRMDIRRHTISISGSIGIALAPAHGSDVETLLSHADAAMYAAKHAGKNCCVVYHEALAADALQRVTLLAQLRSSIEHDALDFMLQPKFDAHRRIVGAELLARWHTPQHGHISPGLFIPLAEQSGLAVALGRLAIRRAATYAAELARQGYPMQVAVNVSPLQIMDDQLDQVLHEACAQHGIYPEQLELEVTESIFLQDSDAPVRRLSALRADGFPIAMDDFGTGYSSLSYLSRLPFDTIKIDRSFLTDVHEDIKSQRVLTGVVNLCKSLGMHTVAEGIETAEQFHLLDTLGVEQYQGFLFARPMPLDDVLTLLRQSRH